MYDLTVSGTALRRKKKFYLEISAGSPKEQEADIFGKWNAGANNITRHCYAFACDDLTPDASSLLPGKYAISLPHPGCASGNPMPVLNTEELAKAIIADGFIFVPERDQNAIKPLKGHYLVAAFVMQIIGENEKMQSFYYSDYHFLRRDEESRIWRHKPGISASVTNQDSDESIIRDPLNANLAGNDSRVTGFSGYFWVPENGIKLGIEIEPLRPPGTTTKEKGAAETATP